MVERTVPIEIEQAISDAEAELSRRYVEISYLTHKFRDRKDYDDGTSLPASWLVEFNVRKAIDEATFKIAVAVDATTSECFLIRPM